jgi:uncharacterized protein YecT (DUF1311 family)
MTFTMTYKFSMQAMLVLSALTALPAHAATDCSNPMAQIDLNTCAAEAYRREDLRLNGLYKQLIGLSETVDKKDIARLKQIQVAWIKFRDLHCDYEENRYAGGSMASMVYFKCMRDLTEQRNATLQALVKDFH